MMARIAPLIERFKTELAADKKRAIILGVLLLVFFVTFIRMLVGGSSPAPVAAQPPVAMAVASTSTAVTTTPVAPGAVVPSVRPSPEAVPEGLPHEAAPSVQPTASPVALPPTLPPADAKPLKPVEIDPGPKQVTRDLFASSAWSSFPSARKSSSTQPSEEEGEPGFWDRLAVGLSERGLEQRGEIARIEKLAQELRLEATMSGDSPCARISGRLVRVGDTIKSFSVVAIEERSVSLALDGHHISLRLP